MSRAKTAEQFAAELAAAGCSIKWSTERHWPGFAATGIGKHVRTVEVVYLIGKDQFRCGYFHGRQVRSMAQVRRLLGINN